VFNSKDGGKKVKAFETSLFKKESLSVAIRVFRCLKLDVARNKVARDHFGKKVPCFLIFNAKGHRVDEVHLKGYKAKSGTLMKSLIKASKGHGKMPLLTFIKNYRTFLNELDKIEGKKKVFNEKKARLLKKGKKDKKSKKVILPKSKQKKLDEEAKRLAKEEKAVLDVEKKLLEAVKAYVPGQRAGKTVARR
jgi:hypothetical protein